MDHINFLKDVKNSINIWVLKLILFLILGLSIPQVTFTQPNWVPGTPSVPSTGPLTITTNYGIDRVGTVYIIVYNWKVENVFTGFDVKIRAQAGPDPNAGRVATAIIPISSGDVGQVLQRIFDVYMPMQYIQFFLQLKMEAFKQMP